jgi:hypothetical protein
MLPRMTIDAIPRGWAILDLENGQRICGEILKVGDSSTIAIAAVRPHRATISVDVRSVLSAVACTKAEAEAAGCGDSIHHN